MAIQRSSHLFLRDGDDMKIDYGRKLYTIPELYRIVYHGIRTMRYMRVAKKKGDLSLELQERIMLAHRSERMRHTGYRLKTEGGCRGTDNCGDGSGDFLQ